MIPLFVKEGLGEIFRIMSVQCETLHTYLI
jgi:hypothetical protein